VEVTFSQFRKMQEQEQEENHRPQNNPNEKESNNNNFECNICLDTAREPVITLCGHLFCWPCIFQWIKDQQEKPCPICKSVISKDKIIPIYGRGSEQKDPRNQTEIPSRPSGQRTEYDPQQHYQGGYPNYYHPFGHYGPPMDTNFHVGFGVFPSLLGLQFQYHGTRPIYPNEQMDSDFISRMLFLLGLFILIFSKDFHLF